MAYQKLQTSRALEGVIHVDNVNIPDISNRHATGTTAAVSASQLVAAAGDFLESITLGDIVYNTTANLAATVTGIVDNVTLDLSNNIFLGVGQDFTIYGDTNNGCVLYFGDAGNVKVLTMGNDECTFQGVLQGTYLPVQVKRVYRIGTTVGVGTINALW